LVLVWGRLATIFFNQMDLLNTYSVIGEAVLHRPIVKWKTVNKFICISKVSKKMMCGHDQRSRVAIRLRLLRPTIGLCLTGLPRCMSAEHSFR
jgi:hypothetical protein